MYSRHEPASTPNLIGMGISGVRRPLQQVVWLQPLQAPPYTVFHHDSIAADLAEEAAGHACKGPDASCRVNLAQTGGQFGGAGPQCLVDLYQARNLWSSHCRSNNTSLIACPLHFCETLQALARGQHVVGGQSSGLETICIAAQRLP